MNEKIAILLVLITIAIAVTNIIRVLLDHIRRWRTERTQAEMYNRTLDKLGSGQEILAYLQSETGSKLFRAMQEDRVAPGQPYARIMSSAQLGVVLAILGAGLFVPWAVLPDPAAKEVFQILAYLGIFAGAAMLASAAVAWFLSKKFGLIDGHGSENQ